MELAGTKWATDGDSSCGLALVLSRGRRIEVEAGFDGPTLQRLINRKSQSKRIYPERGTRVEV